MFFLFLLILNTLSNPEFVVKSILPQEIFPAEIELLVGKHERTKQDVMNFVRAFALIQKIPLNILEKFLQKNYEQFKNIYINELRRSSIIKEQKPDIFKKAQLLKQIEDILNKIKKEDMEEYKVTKYALRELLTMKFAFDIYMKEQSNFGIKVEDKEADFIKTQKEDQYKAHKKGYVLTEIVVDTKDDVDVVLMLLEQFPHNVVALAFSNSITGINGGQLGLLSDIALNSTHQSVLQNMQSKDTNVYMNKESRGWVVYILLHNTDKFMPSNEQIKGMLMLDKRQSIIELLCNNVDGGFIMVK